MDKVNYDRDTVAKKVIEGCAVTTKKHAIMASVIIGYDPLVMTCFALALIEELLKENKIMLVRKE